MPVHIAVLHGPNLNLLGTREPDVYGSYTLDSIHLRLAAVAKDFGVQLSAFQSNHEGELVDKIQSLRSDTQGIILNPAAFTHTSIAMRDALLAVDIPFIEVHLSNVYKREAFRHHSYFSDIAVGCVVGLGSQGYEFALRSLLSLPALAAMLESPELKES